MALEYSSAVRKILGVASIQSGDGVGLQRRLGSSREIELGEWECKKGKKSCERRRLLMRATVPVLLSGIGRRKEGRMEGKKKKKKRSRVFPRDHN